MSGDERPKGIVLVSGGMDSVTLLHYLIKKEQRRPAVPRHSRSMHAPEQADRSRPMASPGATRAAEDRYRHGVKRLGGARAREGAFSVLPGPLA